MADSGEVLRRIPPYEMREGVGYPVLVPNLNGLNTLLDLRRQSKQAGSSVLTDEVAVFVSASDVSSSLRLLC